MTTAVVWFRRDLRVHDHPALARAAREFDRVVPLFILDRALLEGRYRSAPRAAFMQACLEALDAQLRERGAGLVVREGRPEEVLAGLDADAVLWTSDVSPYARARDERVRRALGERAVPCSGNYVADVSVPRTSDGRPYSVFSPFMRRWERLERRPVEDAPRRLRGALEPTGVPDIAAAPFDLPPAGEDAAWERFEAFDLTGYADAHDTLAGGTSALSPYLRWGCLSPRALEDRVKGRGSGREAFRRQLAWRDFYAHVLLHFPDNLRREFQPGLRDLAWDDDAEALDAWREGRTGFPVVDAGMRQLAQTGWMHNRARLVVGSFLTKDLHLDWRLGEEHFARLLLDGEPAQNNGNWQWIASTGVDPAPYFRRMFNPTLQGEKFDPDGAYIRRWVPELRDIDGEEIHDPAPLTREACGYPQPIVDHQSERRAAIERYRAAQA